jgi:hypothetical protein
MGVEIFYSGSLADRSRIPAFEKDLGDLSRERGWHHFYAQDALARSPFPVDLRGLSLIPYPGSGLVHFHVSPDGRFVDMLEYGRTCVSIAASESRGSGQASKPLASAAEEELRRLSPTAYALRHDVVVGELSVRTLKYGPRAHIAVCEVLDYVKQRYAPDLEISDDTDYFVHRDPERLAATMAEASAMMSGVMRAIQGIAEEQNLEIRVSSVDE